MWTSEQRLHKIYRATALAVTEAPAPAANTAGQAETPTPTPAARIWNALQAPLPETWKTLDPENAHRSRTKSLENPFDNYSVESNIQIHVILGLIHACIYMHRPGSAVPYDAFNMPSLGPDSDSVRIHPKKHDTALCTLILTKDRINEKKIREMAADAVDLHIFTGCPDEIDKITREFDHVNVHHINRLKIAKVDSDYLTIELNDTRSDDTNTLLFFLQSVTSRVGLYDVIDSLKLAILKTILEQNYSYVVYQDFAKIACVNPIITKDIVRSYMDRFGIVQSAGFDPEIYLMCVSRKARAATADALKELLRTVALLPTSVRTRANFSFRLIRTLFHINGESPSDHALLRKWFSKLHHVEMNEPHCSEVCVNSMEDIIFAIKKISHGCVIEPFKLRGKNFMLRNILRDPRGLENGSNTLETMLRDYSVHSTLMQQSFLLSHNVIPRGTKVYRESDV